MGGGIGQRPTGELLILLFGVTVCVTLVFSGVALLVLAITHPDRNFDAAYSSVTAILQVLIGITLGYLAGQRVQR